MSLENHAARPARAFIGTDTPLLTAALAELLRAAGYVVEAVNGDGRASRDALLRGVTELAILDLAGTPGSLDLLRDVRAASLSIRVVVLCAADDAETPLDAVELGVDGLLLRTAPVDTVVACIASARTGAQWLDPHAMRTAYDRLSRRDAVPPMLLTRRECDVARLVAAGQRNRVIAGTLGISEGTVKMHLHNVYAKLGLESRTQLATDVRMRALA